MVGWHHQHNGHEFEQTPGNSGGQRNLACCSPWGRKELDMTKQVHNNKQPNAESNNRSFVLLCTEHN